MFAKILDAISTFFCDQEDDSLVKQGKDLFNTMMAEGRDQLSVYACLIEFKAAATLVKMAAHGVLFKERGMSTLKKLESEFIALQQKISGYPENTFEMFREKIIEEKKTDHHLLGSRSFFYASLLTS